MENNPDKSNSANKFLEFFTADIPLWSVIFALIILGLIVTIVYQASSKRNNRGRPTNILKDFNDLFGNIEWIDSDRVRRLITEEIPSKVAADNAYQNAQEHSDIQNARIEHNKALERAMTSFVQDDTQLFKQFSDNESFRKWLSDMVFALTYPRLSHSILPGQLDHIE